MGMPPYSYSDRLLVNECWGWINSRGHRLFLVRHADAASFSQGRPRGIISPPVTRVQAVLTPEMEHRF